MKNSVAEQIKIRRKALNLNQDELAHRAHIPDRTYQDYEGGKRPIPSDRIPDIAKALECTIAELFGELPPASAPVAISPEIQAVIDATVKAAVAAALEDRAKIEEMLRLTIEGNEAEIGRLESHIKSIEHMSRYKKERAVDPHDEIRKGYAAELLEAEKLVESQSDSSSSSSSSESVKRK